MLTAVTILSIVSMVILLIILVGVWCSNNFKLEQMHRLRILRNCDPHKFSKVFMTLSPWDRLVYGYILLVRDVE